MAFRKSRHVTFKSPESDLRKKFPEPTKTFASYATILVKVQKTSEDVSELQKNLAVEAAARKELQLSLEQLKIESKEAKNYQQPQNIIHLLMKKLPCKSLPEIDWLLAFIVDKNLEWVCKLSSEVLFVYFVYLSDRVS